VGVTAAKTPGCSPGMSRTEHPLTPLYEDNQSFKTRHVFQLLNSNSSLRVDHFSSKQATLVTTSLHFHIGTPGLPSGLHREQKAAGTAAKIHQRNNGSREPRHSHHSYCITHRWLKCLSGISLRIPVRQTRWLGSCRVNTTKEVYSK